MLGWPLLVHYCGECHYNTTVEYSATVWKQEHTCSHCGYSSTGADISGKSSAEMNYTQHDELSALFSQRLNFSQQVEPVVVVEVDDRDSMQTETQPEAFVSISAHYTHTTHIRPLSETAFEPSRSPPPTYGESIMPEAMAQLFLQNSIDPTCLLPNQIQLFNNAADEQRLRLLELWRIAPPTYTKEKEHNNSWAPTNMQQEELLAKVRFETNMAARALAAYQKGWSKQQMDFDTHVDPVSISPIRAPGEPAWPPAARLRAASIVASHTVPNPGTEAEPYIVSGYQNSPRTDPVYAASPNLWQSPSYVSTNSPQSTMKDQYGSLMQIRNHADWEAMNERIANDRLSGFANTSSGDDDMIM
ncbi:hypothetical protein AMS68_005979 [Peltaster fructicola]|uniref:Uncharacterized protein n=1 Tax=Peltaster fructicola TaxID=286661 RepID=A0A6H0Y0A1_9PEZI|nr:hypothetical protein AMS68_005979 [Peltaster fructicola]